jgi:hypothetical protein
MRAACLVISQKEMEGSCKQRFQNLLPSRPCCGCCPYQPHLYVMGMKGSPSSYLHLLHIAARIHGPASRSAVIIPSVAAGRVPLDRLLIVRSCKITCSSPKEWEEVSRESSNCSSKPHNHYAPSAERASDLVHWVLHYLDPSVHIYKALLIGTGCAPPGGGAKQALTSPKLLERAGRMPQRAGLYFVMHLTCQSSYHWNLPGSQALTKNPSSCL